MAILDRRCARITVVAAAALAFGVVVAFATAGSAAAASACPKPAPLSLTWPQQAPTLAPGDTGCAVVEWQSLLNDWRQAAETVGATQKGGSLDVDGVFGARTEDATRQFQAAEHVAIDGVVGPMTRLAYLVAPELVAAGAGPAANGSVLGPGSEGLVVAAWQSTLNRWLSATGRHAGHVSVDGVFGPETESATQVFQSAQDVIVDGLVGPTTRAALVDALALAEPTGATAQTVAPSEGATPAAGICDRADGEFAAITLEADTAGPRCLIVSPTQRLRVENGDRATTVELAGWTADLAPGETVTIGPAFAEYLAPGVHTVHVSRYGGSGPQLWLMG